MASIDSTPSATKIVLAIHGGLAGPREKLSSDREHEVRLALRDSLLAGFEVLKLDTGSSLDAVIAAVQVMEDSPHFNAGKGAVYNRSGYIELDAAIMDGKTRRAGAVASIQRVQNPVLAAQTVMSNSTAVFLVGSEADQFAETMGLPMVDSSYFATERRWNEFQAWKENEQHPSKQASGELTATMSKGTVGAVALDRAGNLAAATSTGGVSFKPPGRVGDTGVIGAGTHADNRACAVSSTGDGELFIRSSAAYSVAARMRFLNLDVSTSAQEAIDDIRGLGGNGGLIALDYHGQLAMPYHAVGMYRGSIDMHGNTYIALYED
jgi:beta-aspartyl-peptidase (threonine type)